MDNLISRIKLHEGLSLFPYEDTTGHLTIGYGRNLTEKGITLPEAEGMLTEDLYRASDDLLKQKRLLPHLNRNRRRVCVEMIFCLGLSGFLSFEKMRAAVEKDDFAGAAAEMIDSKWHEQAPKRVVFLAEIMRHGRG